MKKGKLLLIACVAMVIACIFVVSIFAVGNETSTPSLTIVSNTLELKNAVFMNFKVSAENVDDTSSVKLLVWENAPSEYTKDSAQLTLSSIRTESDTGYIVFQYDDLAAKDMTKFIYVCAYIELDGNAIYSKPVKFSIIQYARTILDTSSSDEKLKELVSNMLYYGATAQTYFEHNTDFLATDSVAKIKVVNGTHSDGFKTGYYKTGTSVTLTANVAEEGYAFSHWSDSQGNIIGIENILTISECTSETYTAVYTDTDSTVPLYRYRDKIEMTTRYPLETPWELISKTSSMQLLVEHNKLDPKELAKIEEEYSADHYYISKASDGSCVKYTTGRYGTGDVLKAINIPIPVPSYSFKAENEGFLADVYFERIKEIIMRVALLTDYQFDISLGSNKPSSRDSNSSYNEYVDYDSIRTWW